MFFFFLFNYYSVIVWSALSCSVHLVFAKLEGCFFFFVHMNEALKYFFRYATNRCVCVYLYFQTNNVFALSKSNWKKPLLSFCALILEKFGTNTEENPKDTSWQSGLTRTWRVSLPPLHTNIITQTPEAMLVWGVRCNILMQQEEFKNIFSREKKRQMAA